MALGCRSFGRLPLYLGCTLAAPLTVPGSWLPSLPVTRYPSPVTCHSFSFLCFSLSLAHWSRSPSCRPLLPPTTHSLPRMQRPSHNITSRCRTSRVGTCSRSPPDLLGYYCVNAPAASCSSISFPLLHSTTLHPTPLPLHQPPPARRRIASTSASSAFWSSSPAGAFICGSALGLLGPNVHPHSRYLVMPKSIHWLGPTPQSNT
jgi:hypothetical protein